MDKISKTFTKEAWYLYRQAYKTGTKVSDLNLGIVIIYRFAPIKIYQNR